MFKTIFVLFVFIVGSFVYAEDLPQEAYEHYVAGEEAKTIAERRRHFNEALVKYKQLETMNSSGKLLFNIANTYYHLEDYGHAVLYYQRASLLLPRNEKVQSNLTIALENLNITKKQPSRAAKILFFFHHLLSYAERVSIFIVLGAISLIIWSIYIWQRKRLFRFAAILSTSCWALVFGSLIWTAYLAPPQCVIVKASMLRRDAGLHYQKVTENPLTSGTTAEIIERNADGTWFKVVTTDGQVGFIAESDVEIL